MALRYAPAVQNAIADLITARIDAGSGPGTLKVYTGTLPENLSPSGSTLLATFTLADPVAAGASSGVAVWDFDPDITAIVAADGTAGWFLIEDSTGADVLGGTVGTSGADLNFSAGVEWSEGATVSLGTGHYTQPAA